MRPETTDMPDYEGMNKQESYNRATIGGATKPDSKGSVIGSQSQEMLAAHAALQDELFMLFDKLTSVLSPTSPSDDESERVTPPNSEFSLFLGRELDRVYGMIAQVQKINKRVEL